MNKTLSIYLHIPFCTVKCSYCAFNVYIHLEHLIERFVDALVQEITIVAHSNPGYTVHTVYFGGGTPTLLEVAQFERILQALRAGFPMHPDVHISTEANPNDLLHVDYLQGLTRAGIRRLSIGVQSTQQSELEMFGRLHDAIQVEQAVSLARQAGIESLNLDLIYGVPHQTLAMWRENLLAILALNPDHLSLYGLELEPRTAMDAWVKRGKLPMPDDELAADMYEYATMMLADHGYQQYEISNWAKPGHESRHNLQYWYNEPYLGLGPGAHGYAGGIRYRTVRSPHRYIKVLTEDAPFTEAFPKTPALDEFDIVSREDEIAETIMMGMRLTHEGIDLKRFETRFDISLMQLRGDVIDSFLKSGHLENADGCLRLTSQGRLLSNRILRDLI